MVILKAKFSSETMKLLIVKPPLPNRVPHVPQNFKSAIFL